ncbi:hypothetical protein pb186bvf_004731 [Paramecium bursaria]
MNGGINPQRINCHYQINTNYSFSQKFFFIINKNKLTNQKMIVDDVAPLELNNCRIAYLEISMLTAAFIPYTVLNITQSILVSLLVYLLIPLLLLPYIYIFYVADGKRVFEFYITGNYLHKLRVNSYLRRKIHIYSQQPHCQLLFYSFYSLFYLQIRLHPKQFKITTILQVLNRLFYLEFYLYLHLVFQKNIFGEVIIIIMIDFLIKSLPTNIPMTMLIGAHYIFMIFLIMLLLFEWQYAILCCLIAFLWHIGMVYVRKLFKFSSVLVYGISARLAIFSCYYILFMNIKWV